MMLPEVFSVWSVYLFPLHFSFSLPSPLRSRPGANKGDDLGEILHRQFNNTGIHNIIRPG